ncbi:uncharacterized protein LOC127136123 [Lathyrus oleraceus]|uniref:uncharacterized protein LOC127136123 n=1 Tax=Pisum sativum TaxID=3888 RepID=UPI0021D3981C|nr:uncharacterized protein LOC127136123 [Pisum sativum]
MAQIDRKLDQMVKHVDSHTQSEVGESSVGLELQVKQIEGPMYLSQSKSAKSNVEKIEMESEKIPTYLREENGVYAEDIADGSSCSQQGHSVKGVSTPLSRRDPSPEEEPQADKDDDLSRSEKEVAAEGLCSLGKNLPSKKPASMSHETAEDIVDLEEESSEEEDDTLVHHVKPSAAKKLKTRKGKTVDEMMTARTRKKTTGVGPSKSWSKVEARKRKVRDSSDSKEDVKDDVPDISSAKRQTVKGKTTSVHLDNISFHLEDGATKWKIVIQRRIAVETELGKEAVEVKEVMKLIKVAGRMKTVVGLPQCHEGLVIFLYRGI